ncbi:MAG: hypothetical protein PWP57_1182 [Candidatus Atribacteria bacterium]|nr:hypothetical protein [Candidatus Atribacteria bacterium]
MKKGNWLKWFIVTLVFSLLFGVVGCSNFSIFPPTPTENPNPTPAPTETPVDSGINFTLPNLDGEEVSLREFRGKPVLVFFFKSYCSYCKEEAPTIQRIYSRHQEELVVLGVAVNENHGSGSLITSPEEYTQIIRTNFVNKYNWTFPVLIDNYGKVQTEYVGKGVPSFLFLNEKGEIQRTLINPVSESELESLLYQYLL